jgi:hypothetical protein
MCTWLFEKSCFRGLLVDRIQEESKADKAKQAIKGNSLPKRLGLLGTGNYPSVPLQTFSSEHEDHDHHDQKDS